MGLCSGFSLTSLLERDAKDAVAKPAGDEVRETSPVMTSDIGGKTVLVLLNMFLLP